MSALTNRSSTHQAPATGAPTHRSPSTGSLRLAILASHPIQYFAPWFRHLATLFDLEVLYAHRQDAAGQAAAGFGVEFEWDVPLLEGYRYRWLKNVSRKPGLQTFGGCHTPELFDLIRPANYDALLVLGWNRKSFVQGIRAAWRNKVPVLARGDSQLRSERSMLKRALKFIPYRWFLPRIDAHLYVGQRNREYLRHYGVRDKQLFFSPHFVDNEWFREKAEQLKPRKAEIRKQWGIPEDAFVPLFVGKFIPKKRPMDLVKATRLLLSSDSKLQAPSSKPAKLHLLFVGSGALGAGLRANCNVVFDAEPVQRSENSDQRSERVNLTSLRAVGDAPEADLRPLNSGTKPSASFAGFLNQSEIPKAYAASDVLVLPSDKETWGLVVNEAMACRLPAIVSDVAGCAPDMIDDGLTGYTFPMGDIAALAQRVTNFLSPKTEELRRKSEFFSMEQATGGLKEAVETLLTRKRLRHD